MAKVPFFEDDIGFISKLTNKPTADTGMPPATLKAEFDKAGKVIQSFLNETLIPAVNAIVAVTGVTDKTLTLEEAPADAKAVGDRLSTVEGCVENDVLKKAGGEMSGAISMGGNKVTGLGTPTDSADAATKAYVDGKRLVKTATLTTSWSGSSAPYTQVISSSLFSASDMPHISPVYSTTNATAILQKEAWSKVCKAVTGDGTITFTCFEDKPTTAIPIQIEVMR